MSDKANAKAGKSLPAKGAKRKAPPKRPKARPKNPGPARAYASGPPIDSELALLAGLEALGEIDRETVALMRAACGVVPLRERRPGFEGLVWIVLSQQVSVASANAIAARVKAGLSPLSPAAVLAASDEALRACGLSAPKMRTLRAISVAIESGALDLDALGALDPLAAHEALVAVKGVGPWTADIFLLFCLGHPDAFPAGDLALQEAARLALKLKKRPDRARLEKIAERWRPWRGVAARLLWAYYGAVKARAGMALAEDTPAPKSKPRKALPKPARKG